MSTATVTAKTGPAVQDTAIVISGVIRFDVQLDANVIFIYTSRDNGMKQYSLSGVTTFTVSISGSTYTLTIS